MTVCAHTFCVLRYVRFTPKSGHFRMRFLPRRVFGERVRRVTCITSTVLSAHISDQRFGVLCLGLEGGDERIFPVHDHVLALSFQLKPDGK